MTVCPERNRGVLALEEEIIWQWARTLTLSRKLNRQGTNLGDASWGWSMPRYFFDTIENGQIIPDDQGLEMSLPEMREEANRVLPELAVEHPLLADRNEFVVRVRDESGRDVYEVSLILAAKLLLT
ncbi:hypothetical protein LB533_13690 [Mesorhizobium sp. BR1-1-13]|uniref:DUF6894 family protein n=1 Tax=Mesorhizobium sp. BR1-1-13 TaxID=2876656 RepID=UPI001CD14742|nr:hypothetical protein [Mesorhizobium sp. BR1-1-13]MBZ9942156.1 hypothetical protein [Mesorhizobium sp. BR1-1-13]